MLGVRTFPLKKRKKENKAENEVKNRIGEFNAQEDYNNLCDEILNLGNIERVQFYGRCFDSGNRKQL